MTKKAAKTTSWSDRLNDAKPHQVKPVPINIAGMKAGEIMLVPSADRFIRSIPAELEDAAVIDGCGRFGFFWRILLPLSGPALATVAIITFIASWNAYQLPYLVLTDSSGFTLPLGVANYASQYTQDTARILAFTALSMVPALAFFVLAERRIVGGLSGAVRG